MVKSNNIWGYADILPLKLGNYATYKKYTKLKY